MPYNRLRRELYYILRLFSPKYSPNSRLNFRHYLQYFKNKFFGDFLAAREKPVVFTPEDDFEIHILSQKGNAWMLINCLKSFIHHSGLCPKIIIHSDGSIDEEMDGILKNKFSGLEVVPRFWADDFIYSNPELSDKVKRLRKTKNNLLLKLIDIPMTAKAEKILITGDDIMFYSKPQEIIDFVRGRSSWDAIVSRDDGNYDMRLKKEHIQKYNLFKKEADYINSDFLLFKRELITVNDINEYFDNTLADENFYLLEMAGLASILAKGNIAFFPLKKYHIKGPITAETIFKHYTSPRRQELFAYGIDEARKKTRGLNV